MADYLERFMMSLGKCDSDLDSCSDIYSESDQISYVSDDSSCASDGIRSDLVLDLNVRPMEVSMSVEPTVESYESDGEVIFPIIESVSSGSDDDVILFPIVESLSSDDENTEESYIKSKNILQCSVCKKICRSVPGLAVHKLIHERGYVDKLFKCKTCGKRYSSASNLGSHMRVHKIKVRKSQKDKLKCAECGKICRSVSGLAVHSQIHTQKYKNKGFKCKRCGKGCRSGAGLAHHKAVCEVDSSLA